MANLFPVWSDTAFRVVLLMIAVGGLSAIIFPMIYVRTPYHDGREYPVDQPVQFDHRHHVQDDHIDCLYCHGQAERSAYAGVPSTELCLGCHNQVWTKSPMLEPVRRSYFTGLPIPWNRVHNLPDYVYFNHAIHVNKGVGCISCHGRVDQMALVYQVSTLQMGFCLDCHRDPAPNLRPLDQITSMTWKPGGDPREVGERIARELSVRKLVHCSTCHR